MVSKPTHLIWGRAESEGHWPSLSIAKTVLSPHKEFWTQHRRAFPDIHYTLEEVVAEGEKVVVRWTATGTHQGDLMGIAPTGKLVKAPGITIFRFAHGHMVEGRTVWDALAFLQQLGVVPAPGQTS
jgi:predicted ester cyclase